MAPATRVYRRVFDFWLKVFAVSFGMGVVSGIVMAFQFGTNWSVLAEKTGSIQGPLLGYETFTAFMLEATFLGVVLLGRDRVPPLVLFPRLLHGLARDDGLVVLDPRQQQLDAGAGRPHRSSTARSFPSDWTAIIVRGRCSWSAGCTCCWPRS